MDTITTSFLTVFVTGIVVIFISRGLDFLWARVVPVRFFYYVIRAPGVIVHELSHVLGCLLMGAKIKNIVFFSEKGGSVTYSAPAVPYFGDVVIISAPIFFIPLVLAGCTWFFSQYLGCVFPSLIPDIGTTDTFFSLVAGIVSMFTRNLIVTFNAWFLLYLYLTLTLVLSIAPSDQDAKNAAIGIGIIALIGILILWSSLPFAVSILMKIISFIEMGFILGLLFGIIALVISVPVVILYIHKNFV